MDRQLMHRPQRIALLAALVGTLTMSPRTVSAQATEFTDNLFIPFTLFTAGCGDFITVTGTLHILIHLTIDAAGGIAAKGHFQPQGATGVGTSGATYQATGVTQEEFTSNGPGPQLEDTFVNNFRMISHGTAPNFDVHENFHITINNNGEVTVIMDNFSIECRG